MTKVEELLAYFDRLIALTKLGNIRQREITEVVEALREELVLGSSPYITVDGRVLAEKLQKLDSRLGRL